MQVMSKMKLIFFALILLLAGSPAISQTQIDPRSRLNEAKVLAQDGKLDSAIELLDNILVSTPSIGAEALFQKGLIQFTRQKKYDDAISTFIKIAELYPESRLCDDAYYYAGFIAQYRLSDSSRALQLYRTGYENYPHGDYRFSIADKIKELSGSTPGELLSNDALPRPEAQKPPEGISVSSDRTDAGVVRRTPPETDVSDTSPFRPRGAKSVTVQFDKAPLRNFIQWVAQVTGRNFIIDDDVSGDITVFSGKQVPLTELYRIFLSILDVKGFAAVEAGNVTKIVTRQQAAQSELPILIDDDAYVPTDRVITRIFRLKSISAASLQTLIRPFLLGADQVAVNPETNSLIVTGPAGNVAKIAEIINIVDSERTPIVVRSYLINHAKAAQIADKLTNIFASLNPQGATAPAFKVIADERTNMVYVLADEAYQSTARDLIRELDTDRTADRIVKVILLNYAKADEVTKQLRTLLGLESIDNAPDYGGITQTILIPDMRLNSISLSTFAPRIVTLVDSYISRIDQPPSDNLRSLKIIRLQNAEASKLAEILSKMFGAQQTASSAAGAATSEATVAGLADKVIITADDRTNSLLVTSTSVDWIKIEKAIKDLDVRKTQVLIDAVVLETNLDEARNLGASLMTANQPSEGHTIGFARSDPVGFLPTYQALAAQGGLTIGAARGSVVAAMLNALLTSSKTNVLQMPQILALDNEIATLSVGNLTPIVTSRSISGDNVQIGGTSSIFQNVEYRNIGLNLKLKPHIGNQGDILIESRIEIQNRNTQAEAGLSLPVFTTREIEQKFQIQDGDYIVLGGLLRTQDDFVQTETPWLSRIPLLGTLFKSSRTTNEKTVLLIFLRPRVVTDPERSRAITEEEHDQFSAESSTRPGAAGTESDKWIQPEN